MEWNGMEMEWNGLEIRTMETTRKHGRMEGMKRQQEVHGNFSGNPKPKNPRENPFIRKLSLKIINSEKKNHYNCSELEISMENAK